MLEYAEPIEIREPEYFGDEMAQELDRRAESGEDGDQEMQSWKESEATNPATQLLSTIVAMMGLSGSGSSDVDNDSRLDPLFQLLLLPSEEILHTFDSP